MYLANAAKVETTSREIAFRFEVSSRSTKLNVTIPKNPTQPLAPVILAHGQGKQVIGKAHLIYQPCVQGLASATALIDPKAGLFAVFQIAYRDGMEPNVGASAWVERHDETEELVDRLPAIAKQMKFELGMSGWGGWGHSEGSDTIIGLNGMVYDVSPPVRVRHNPSCAAIFLMSPQGDDGRMFNGSWNDIDAPMYAETGELDPGRAGQPWQWRLTPHIKARSCERGILIHHKDHGAGSAVGVPTGIQDPATRDTVVNYGVTVMRAYLLGDADAHKALQNPEKVWGGAVLADSEYCAAGEASKFN